MEPLQDDAQSAFPPPTGLALASLVLGIAAIGLSFLVVGLLAGAVGIVLGLRYLGKKRGPTGMARWGIGLSIFGIVVSLGFAALYYYVFNQIKGTVAANATTVTISGASGVLANPPPLTNSSSPLTASLVWSTPMGGAQTLCAGDWAGDGSARVLVAAGQMLHVLDLAGAEKSTLPLPDRFTSIECGRISSGPCLLGYTRQARQVSVIDKSGKIVWTQGAFMGVDGAHLGDLNADGDDVVIMGMNGFGGLQVYSSNGKKLWSASLGNVWSQAIIPPSSNEPAVVLATDASGSVNVFDKAGKRLNSLRPDGGYYAQMIAGRMESNAVQILGFSGNAVQAFDLTGKAAWTAAAQPVLGAQRPCAAMGDFAGDGSRQWAFVDGAGDLVIVTTGGLKIASIPKQGGLQGLAAAPQAKQRDLLITLSAGTVQAYSFRR